MKNKFFVNLLLIVVLIATGFLQYNSVSGYQSEDVDVQTTIFYKIPPDFNIRQFFTLGDSSSITNIVLNEYTTALITISETEGLVTTEAPGGTDIFTVVLNSQPTADVTIGLESSDPGEGTVSPASLTFTNGDWDSPQTVTVTGVDDDIDDGDQIYAIILLNTVSADTKFDGIDLPDVSVTNTDDDIAGVTVIPTSGLVTTEAPGGTDTFTVVLNSQPTADVTIGLESSDPGEGTVSPSSLTFTSGNWNTSRTVTVTGVDDDIVDGDQGYKINISATSTDSKYNDIPIDNVSVTNTDDDVAGVTVTLTSGLVTTEAPGGTDTFTVVLNSQPTADVTIGLESSDPGEGTVSPSSLTFTPSDWDETQTVTVTGVDDAINDGDVGYTVKVSYQSGAGEYSDLVPVLVSLINIDDDIAGVTVTPTSGLETTEAGGTDTFTVKLNSQPTANVTIGLSSNDTTEGTVSPTTLTFTGGNWNTPRTVTVTGVDDDLVDGNQGYKININATSTDSKYNNIPVDDVSVTNTDDDVAGISIDPMGTTISTSEDGTTDQFTVILDAKPYGTVNIHVVSSDETEGIVTKPVSGYLVFTPSNWNSPQQVIVTGVDDDLQDGIQYYTIKLGKSSITDSRDSSFAGLTKVINASNSDNDTAGIFITQTDGLVTSETGQTAQFSLKLNTQPLADVTIHLAISNPNEGVITVPEEPHELTYTKSNWSVLQQVTVTGVDDVFADGDQAYKITLSVTSDGADYDGLPNIPSVNLINLDDDFSPVAQEDTYYINREELVVEAPGVLINDTDENDDTLTAVKEVLPLHAAKFELNGDGSFTYQAQSGFEGIDSFTYKAFDGISHSDETTVYIHVDTTLPPVPEWKSPVGSGGTFDVNEGTVTLQAMPQDLNDFDYIEYKWWDNSKWIDLGSANLEPYLFSLDVEILNMGINFIGAYAYDKAGNRSAYEGSLIKIKREPFYNQYIYLPIIQK